MRGGEFEGKTEGGRTPTTDGLALPSRALTALTPIKPPLCRGPMLKAVQRSQ